MYTLLIVLFLKGASISTEQITGFKSEAACRAAIQKIQSEVMMFGVEKSFSCVKLTD